MCQSPRKGLVAAFLLKRYAMDRRELATISVSRAQKTNLIPSCICRAAVAVAVIRPTAGSTLPCASNTAVDGAPKFARFSTLKNSRRSWSTIRSQSLQWHVLDDGKVEYSHAGTEEGIPADIAQCCHVGECKRRWVEVLIRPAKNDIVTHVSTGHQVRAVYQLEVCGGGSLRHGKRMARRQAQQPVHLPPSRKHPHNPGVAGGRQLVGRVEREVVGNMERGEALEGLGKIPAHGPLRGHRRPCAFPPWYRASSKMADRALEPETLAQSFVDLERDTVKYQDSASVSSRSITSYLRLGRTCGVGPKTGEPSAFVPIGSTWL